MSAALIGPDGTAEFLNVGDSRAALGRYDGNQVFMIDSLWDHYVVIERSSLSNHAAIARLQAPPPRWAPRGRQ